MKKYFFILFFMGLSAQAQSTDSDPAFDKLLWEYAPDSYKTSFITSDSELKVFWWNIACNNINDQMVRELNQPEALFNNLVNLAQTKAPPDVLILGEHCPGHFPKKTVSALKKVYPHQYSLDRTNSHARGQLLNGIWVFSKWPVKLISKEVIDLDTTEKLNRSTSTTYVLLKVSRPEKNFYLSPVHLYNPWKNMALWDIALNAGSSETVNYKQADATIQYLKDDLDLSADDLLVIGDFNAARNFWNTGLSMGAYNLFGGFLHDVGGNETTFPTPTARTLGNGFPDVQIDHVFSRGLNGSSVMLPLKGSDHYAILFKL